MCGGLSASGAVLCACGDCFGCSWGHVLGNLDHPRDLKKVYLFKITWEFLIICMVLGVQDIVLAGMWAAVLA